MDILFLINSDGTILHANESGVKQYLGKELHDAIGINFFNLFNSETAERRKHIITETISSKKSADFIEEQSGYIFSGQVMPMPDSNKNIENILICCKDMTDILNKEIELKKKNRELLRLLLLKLATKEMTVLKEIANGTMSTKEISYNLKVVESAVSNCKKRIIEKLSIFNINTRKDLVSFAVKYKNEINEIYNSKSE